VEVSVGGFSGKVGVGSFSFEVAAGPEEDPPVLDIVSPRPIVLDEPRPEILVEYVAVASPLDLSSLRIELDGAEITAGCAITQSAASCPLLSDLAAGPHLVAAEVRSTGGTLATAVTDFEIVLGEGPHTVGVTAGAADAYLDPDDPTANFGTLGFLRLGAGSGSRVLVRLADEALLPLGDAELVSARLIFDVAANGGGWSGGRSVDVHRLRLTPWSESDASWLCPLEAGCDPTWDGGAYDLAPTASVIHDDTTSGEVAFDVTPDVADFLRTGINLGWLVKKTDESAPGLIDYFSRETADGPRLELTFANPEPADPATDTDPPSLAFTEPRVPVLLDETETVLVVTYGDADGSGIDLPTLRLTVDGADVTAGCVVEPSFATCPATGLGGSSDSVTLHRAQAEIRDRAGNTAAAEREVMVILGQGDLQDPTLTVTNPPDGALFTQEVVEVTGTVSDDGVIAAVLVDGVEAEVEANAFRGFVTLAEGDNPIPIAAIDGAGHRVESLLLLRLDTTPPELEVQAPEDGLSTNGPTVVVRGRAEDVGGGLASVTVQGIPVTVVDGLFEQEIALAEGSNQIVVRAVDTAGNETVATRTVELFSLPEVAITSPAELGLINDTEVVVTGTVSAGVVNVEVDGAAASLSGGSFTSAVPVVPGINHLVAVARDAAGKEVSTTVTVIRDDRPPTLTLDSPSEGAVAFDSPIVVRGHVKDLDFPAADGEALRVTVNGMPATVSGTTFLLPSLELAPGENVLTVRALDQAENATEVTATVRLETPSGNRLRIVSGDLQEAQIGTRLPAPLVVEALDVAGQPVPGQTVVFRVAGNNGFLDDLERQMVVTTDAQGRASVEFTLGTRAGAGGQRVEAAAAGFSGPVAFTASGLVGPPAMVVVDSGAGQTGVVGELLPGSLVAVVVDEGKNRLPGVAVEFTVVGGDGTFEDGSRTVTVVTDDAGHAAVRFRLGMEAGVANHVVEAAVPGLTEEFAAFVASGRTAGDPARTAVSGVVLDNTDLPVPGVTVSIADTPLATTTGADGRFRIGGAPVGLLAIHFDGSTTSRPGIWPTLVFMINAIPGRENDFGRPIYMLPIDVERGLAVSETEGGTLTLPEIPTFALEIAPGSVTFPDGSREGVVSVTVVNTTKIPRSPNFGQQPRFLITIQPAGARFDPPARFTLPNTDGLEPGQVTEMYSFDHDLFRFVSIGPATVTEDGTRIVSNPGFGVVEAGWHCGGDPASSGTTHDCPTCRTCVRDRCVPDDGQTPEQSSTRDCKREICRDGSVTSVNNDQEFPEQTPGNCTEARCQNGRPIFLTDLTDPPPGLACCGIQLSPLAPLIYNPETTCCLLEPRPRRVPRHPVQDLDACPELGPYEHHVPMANGCGPEGALVGGIDVPDDPAPGCPPFTPACNAHDLCWDMCRNSLGHKLGCDLDFFNNLNQVCQGCSNALAAAACRELAKVYAAAVGGGGFGAYEAAQKQACQCCSN
jgi:hypothetical protein